MLILLQRMSWHKYRKMATSGELGGLGPRVKNFHAWREAIRIEGRWRGEKLIKKNKKAYQPELSS